MSNLMDIDDHKADPMLRDFCERRDADLPNALDRANAALLRASQAATIHAEDADDCDRAFILSTHERVQLAAAATATALRVDQGDESRALEFARVAEGEALVLDSYDSSSLDGLRRPTPLAA